MRYLDNYVQDAAKDFQAELSRVSGGDIQAAKLLEQIAGMLLDVQNGKIVPPSGAFDGISQRFIPDQAVSAWAARLYWEAAEKRLFHASSAFFNAMVLKDDQQFSLYCKQIGFVFPDGWPGSAS